MPSPPATDDLYSLPIREQVLLVSPLRRIAALVNTPTALALHRALIRGDDASLGSPQEALVAALRRTPAVAPDPPRGPLAPAFLGLVVTRACNGGCRYCGFGAEPVGAGAMDPKLALELVRWMARSVRARGVDRLEVHLFGGEPLVVPDLVDVVVHATKAEAAAAAVRPHLEVSTNGVVDPAYARWIGRHFDAVVLSLDGPEEIHDRHRPLRNGRGSFSQAAATARILGASDAALCLRCAVSAESVSALEETGRWLAEQFGPSAVDFEPVTATAASRAAGLRPPDPFEFAVRYLRLRRQLGALGVDAVYSATETEGPRTTACPVGRDTVIATPDGVLGSCYLPAAHQASRGQPCDIGTFTNGDAVFDLSKVERLRRLHEHKPRCCRCFCRWTCSGGCHVDVTGPGCASSYDDYCLQTRVITAGLLLEALGAGEGLDRLLADDGALRRLAMRPSDALVDREGAP